MTTNKKTSVGIALAALAVLGVWSCSAIIPGDPPTTGDPPANPDPGNTTPEPVKPTPADPNGNPVPMPSNGNPAMMPTPIETPVTPPPPEVLDAERAMQAKLDALTAAVPGTKVKFINCTESPCTARIEGRTLTAVRDLLDSLSKDQQGRIDFVVREQLDAYMGQSYYTDVTIGTDKKRAVPADATELLE